jgi:hypothetical protein
VFKEQAGNLPVPEVFKSKRGFAAAHSAPKRVYWTAAEMEQGSPISTTSVPASSLRDVMGRV